MSSRILLPQARWSLVLVLAAFLTLGIIYSNRVPIFEKPDELFHYFFVQHLLDERSLPVMGGPGDNLWEQEGSQPPLYYTLAALATSWVDTSEARELLWLNPQRNLGDPENPGNKNFIVHTDRETQPYRGATLAVHIARWLSLLFGAGTVVLIYIIVQHVFPARPLLALSAAAAGAFIPQFLFISTSVSNDSLITFLAALTLLQLIRFAAGAPAPNEGDEPYHCEWRACGALGITIGLAVLTKLSGLALLVLSGLTFSWIAWQRRSWRILVTGGLIVGGLTAVIAGWWFVRNLQLYGSLDGIDLHLQAMGGRRELALTAESVWRELIGLRASFWGLFGWFNILMPQWVYQVIDLLTLTGVIGLARRQEGRNWGQGTALALLWVALVLISLLRWTTMVEGSQGRLLFPALPGIVLLLSLGWSNVLPARWKNWRYAFPLGVAGGLFVLSAVVPSRIIAPAYARPQLLEVDALPAGLSRKDITFGERIYLHGCQSDHALVRPGRVLAVTCYWEALAPLTNDYFTYHHLLGRGLEPVGKEHGYPGSGSFPTTLWPSGRVIAATEWIRVGPDTVGPALGRLSVGVYHPETRIHLEPVNSLGHSLELVVAAEFKIAAPARQTITVANPIHYSVGDVANLVGFEIKQGDPLRVVLIGEATAVPLTHYSVFVHLLDESGAIVGQGDGPPVGGDYPTRLWEPGELIVDEHKMVIDLDAQQGSYHLAIGWYRLEDGIRLPVRDEEGIPQSEDRVILPAVVELP